MLLKTKYLSEFSETYDGSQLKPLWIYLHHGLLGSSGVAWVGPCQIPFDKMIDGEDKRAGAQICGDLMVHFIFELFDINLFSAVCFQRLMANWIQSVVYEENPSIVLRREGDDLYWGEKKFSISIATQSTRSCVVHFAVNVTNQGTPVLTCALSEFQIEPTILIRKVFERATFEWSSIWEATYKVHPL
jgi:hypothetical protein